MAHELTYVDLLVRLGLAIALGGAIGLEREIGAQPAGLRTHLLVAMGSVLFTSAGLILGARTDLTRVGAQVVSGIGFLGAGAILQDRGRIKGLTTAASLWGTAAVGVAIGFGYYAGAATFTAATLVVLTGLKRLEHGLFPQLRGRTIVVTVSAGTTVVQAVDAVRQVVAPVEVERVRTLDTGALVVRLAVPSRRAKETAELADALMRLPEVAGVEVQV